MPLFLDRDIDFVKLLLISWQDYFRQSGEWCMQGPTTCDSWDVDLSLSKWQGCCVCVECSPSSLSFFLFCTGIVPIFSIPKQITVFTLCPLQEPAKIFLFLKFIHFTTFLLLSLLIYSKNIKINGLICFDVNYWWLKRGPKNLVNFNRHNWERRSLWERFQGLLLSLGRLSEVCTKHTKTISSNIPC